MIVLLGGDRSGVASGASDDFGGGWDVGGSENKDGCGPVNNNIDGENRLWLFEFSCKYIKLLIIWDIFEENLVCKCKFLMQMIIVLQRFA